MLVDGSRSHPEHSSSEGIIRALLHFDVANCGTSERSRIHGLARTTLEKFSPCLRRNPLECHECRRNEPDDVFNVLVEPRCSRKGNVCAGWQENRVHDSRERRTRALRHPPFLWLSTGRAEIMGQPVIFLRGRAKPGFFDHLGSWQPCSRPFETFLPRQIALQPDTPASALLRASVNSRQIELSS